MKKKISKFLFFAKQNFEIAVLVFSLILLVFLTHSYNSIKDKKKQNFYNILENVYFKKTLTFYLENLAPKYININHKITSGESLEKILLNYDICFSRGTSMERLSEIYNFEINHFASGAFPWSASA